MGSVCASRSGVAGVSLGPDVLFPHNRIERDQEPLGLAGTLPAIFTKIGLGDDECQALRLVRDDPIVWGVYLAGWDYFMFHQGVTTTY